MLKRIVVVGGDASAADQFEREAKKRNLVISVVGAGHDLPASTAALLDGGAKPREFVSLADSLAQRQHEMLFLLAECVDSREELQLGSSKRVMECASLFGRALELEPEQQNTLERGALLRDIGKLRIPNSILLKYTILTHDEWITIRRHTHFGGDVVTETSELRDIEPIVRSHHECWDGTGYPDGLEGNAIPRLAHIVRIVDVFCAMTAKRHYRPNVHSVDAAIEHLAGESGKHFAPDLVEAFINSKIATKFVETS